LKWDLWPLAGVKRRFEAREGVPFGGALSGVGAVGRIGSLVTVADAHATESERSGGLQWGRGERQARV
jgi:hypothetical protein